MSFAGLGDGDVAAAGGFLSLAGGGDDAGFDEGGDGGGGFRLGDTRDTSAAFLRVPHAPAAEVLHSTLAPAGIVFLIRSK